MKENNSSVKKSLTCILEDKENNSTSQNIKKTTNNLAGETIKVFTETDENYTEGN